MTKSLNCFLQFSIVNIVYLIRTQLLKRSLRCICAMPPKFQTAEFSFVMLNVAISKCWKSRITGKWVPAVGRTDWFHYKLLRQSKHLCVEARYTVVNKWEFSLAQRPAGVAWHGSNPCSLIFSVPQKSSCILCCLLAEVPGLHQPLNCAQTLSGKNETLGTGQNCATRRASSFPAWVIAVQRAGISPGPASLSKAGWSPACPASC